MLNVSYFVQDFSNKMFILFYFKKKVRSLYPFQMEIRNVVFCSMRGVGFRSLFFFSPIFAVQEKQNAKEKEIEWPELKPCLYKRRWSLRKECFLEDNEDSFVLLLHGKRKEKLFASAVTWKYQSTMRSCGYRMHMLIVQKLMNVFSCEVLTEKIMLSW